MRPVAEDFIEGQAKVVLALNLVLPAIDAENGAYTRSIRKGRLNHISFLVTNAAGADIGVAETTKSAALNTKSARLATTVMISTTNQNASIKVLSQALVNVARGAIIVSTGRPNVLVIKGVDVALLRESFASTRRKKLKTDKILCGQTKLKQV